MSIKGNFWPNSSQDLLLRACLSENHEEALSSWQEWQATSNLDKIDAGSYRLIPLLTWRLQTLGQRTKISPIFLGCLRQSWVSSIYMQKSAASAIKLLKDKGIPTLIFKGLALELAAYPKHGLRPMLDVDIAVPRLNAGTTWDVLVENGWHPSQSRERTSNPYLMALEFTHPKHGNIDVHFLLFHESLDEELTQQFWGNARPIKVQDQECLTVCETDLLFHVISHGLRVNTLPSIRWIPDAIYIIRYTNINWKRFTWQAEKMKNRLAMKHGLTFLVNNYHCNVPSWVLEELENEYSVFEKLEFQLIRFRGFNRLTILAQFIRLHPGKNALQLLAMLPNHLQKVWDQPTLIATFFTLCAKILRAANQLIFNNTTGERK